MKSHKLKQIYLEKLKNEDFSVTPDDVPVATLFGEDEFHINLKQHTLYIKDIGVIELQLDSPDIHVDWVALILKDEEWVFSLGTGNPYDEQFKEILPFHNNQICAIPNIVYKKMK